MAAINLNDWQSECRNTQLDPLAINIPLAIVQTKAATSNKFRLEIFIRFPEILSFKKWLMYFTFVPSALPEDDHIWFITAEIRMIRKAMNTESIPAICCNFFIFSSCGDGPAAATR